jgi:hypothetical protein
MAIDAIKVMPVPVHQPYQSQSKLVAVTKYLSDGFKGLWLIHHDM